MTEQWKVGQLIEKARMRAGLSKRAAAEAAGISETWWRQIEAGTITKNGVPVPVEVPPGTAVRAALVIGLDIKTMFAEWPRPLSEKDDDDILRETVLARVKNLTKEELVVAEAFLSGLNSRTS